MRLYERGDLTTATAAGSIAAELRAINRPMFVEELGLFLNAATASILGFGRAGVAGVGGTVGLGDADLGGDEVASEGGVVLAATTAATAPSPYKRQISIPGAIGNGIVWTWPMGLRIKAGTSLVLVNIALSSALRLYVRWRE